MQSTGQASTQAVSFTPMQGSAMTYVIGHLLLPRYASWSGDSNDAGSRLLGYDHDGGEDFGGDVSGFEHEGFRAVLQRCFGHGDYLRRRRWIFFFSPRQRRKHPNPESRAGSFGSRLGADDFLRGGCGCVLGTSAGKGTSARESARRVLG